MPVPDHGPSPRATGGAAGSAVSQRERDAADVGELAEGVDVERGGASDPVDGGVDAGEPAERVPPVAAAVVRALLGDAPARRS